MRIRKLLETDSSSTKASINSLATNPPSDKDKTKTEPNKHDMNIDFDSIEARYFPFLQESKPRIDFSKLIAVISKEQFINGKVSEETEASLKELQKELVKISPSDISLPLKEAYFQGQFSYAQYLLCEKQLRDLCLRELEEYAQKRSAKSYLNSYSFFSFNQRNRSEQSRPYFQPNLSLFAKMKQQKYAELIKGYEKDVTAFPPLTDGSDTPRYWI